MENLEDLEHPEDLLDKISHVRSIEAAPLTKEQLGPPDLRTYGPPDLRTYGPPDLWTYRPDVSHLKNV
ncbi:hypothetical protein D4764_11G0000790 [Takifugu flavidus]|uniref:Uncharacterized protein n=1 Tax=Takifugu flavidus TaxID=433684 RepID=A0A5C6PH02_9TELE|nr:hypothetical protein D4764_11G0000790 [Takifugu flavidus]